MKPLPAWSLPPLVVGYPHHNLPVIIFSDWEPSGSFNTPARCHSNRCTGFQTREAARRSGISRFNGRSA